MKKKQKSTFKIKAFIIEIWEILLVILLALTIRLTVFEPFCVPTSSMLDTILTHDYIFGTKYSYGYSKYSIPFPSLVSKPSKNNGSPQGGGRILNFNPPKVGDIIIFYVPKLKIRYVKRLIGLPNDKIQMVDGQLYINGKEVRKDFEESVVIRGTSYNKYTETLPNGYKHSILELDDDIYKYSEIYNQRVRYRNTEVFTVPAGKYFFMGDNRDQSLDSRADLSYVDEENIIGKARFIYFSTGEKLFSKKKLTFSQQIKRVGVWLKSIRWDRIFSTLN